MNDQPNTEPPIDSRHTPRQRGKVWPIDPTEPMLCPRCREPMVPTNERAASWACHRCVLLVIPMGPADEH